MISKDCTITIDKGNASVDEDVYLYKNDMNIQILFTIVNNKYRYTKNTAIDNIIANNKASYAQVKFKKGDIEIDFEEQETKDGAVVLLIKKELIDEDTELGDYSIQIRLFDENKTSVITLPPVENCIHIQRPLFEKAGEDTNIVDQALTDMAVVTYAEPISATNSDGTYNKKTWISKEKITTAELNRMEEGISNVSSQCKDTANFIESLEINVKFPPFGLSGAVGDGKTDDTEAIQSIINFVELNCKGATIKFPDGDYKITNTITVKGCNKIPDLLYTGGVVLTGTSMRATRIIKANGGSIINLGSDASKNNIQIKNMTLLGTRNNNSLGIDSRTVGGSYLFDSLLIDNCDIGIRFHDCTYTLANIINFTNCGTGLALGYYSDIMRYVNCRFNKCDLGVYVGYYDTDRGQTKNNASHASGLFSCGFLLNNVDVYIAGNDIQCFTLENCYFEQHEDVSIRIGDPKTGGGVYGSININNCYFNGNRLEATTGKKPFLIEVNNANNVTITGGGFTNFSDSAIVIKHNNGGIRCIGGNYVRNTANGDVKLVNNSYRNISRGNLIVDAYIARTAPAYAMLTHGLPSANSNYLNVIANVNDVLYKCEKIGESYIWEKIPEINSLKLNEKYIMGCDFIDFTGTTTKSNFGAIQGWNFESGKTKDESSISTTIPCPNWNSFDIYIMIVNNSEINDGNYGITLDYSKISIGGIQTNTTSTIEKPCGENGKVQLIKYFHIDINGTEDFLGFRLSRNDVCAGDFTIIGIKIVKTS
jgi:hypothetical protein